MGEPVKKITANLPSELLEQAQRATGLGITETLVLGLREIERSRQRSLLRALKGRVRISLGLKESRK